MKASASLFFLLALLISPLPAKAERPITAASSISSVTVFADRAQVTRSASVSLKAGSNLISVDGLPRLLAEESLRVEGKGSGRARIAGLTVKNVYLERVQEKRAHELEDEIALVNRKLESIEARRKALAAQRDFIESIRVGWGERISKELAAGKPTAAELNEASKFVGEGVHKVEEQAYDAEAAKKPLNDKLAALKKELDQITADRMKEVRSVLVAVDADREMKFNLELSYLVSQAGWAPAYDVRLLPDGREAEIVYRALVWQRSGEDWPGVRLSLSTASPEVGGAPPELTPWRIAFYEPPRPVPFAVGSLSMMQAPAAKSGAKRKTEELGAAEPEEQAVPVTAQVAEGETAVVFNVPQPVDIPTGGTRSGSVIAVHTVPVSAEYVTVPKLSPHVYLTSKVTNDTPYPLLPGEVNIFNDAFFTGKTHLKTVPSGDKFELSFGADNQVKVKREVAKLRKEAGFLSGNKVSYRTTIELNNLKKKPITLSVLDQLPLPGNAEIKVSLDDAKPKPDETRQDGTLVWKLNLASGEKRKISYDIEIEYPKNHQLTGLE